MDRLISRCFLISLVVITLCTHNQAKAAQNQEFHGRSRSASQDAAIQADIYQQLGQLEAKLASIEKAQEKAESNFAETMKRSIDTEKYFWILSTLALSFFVGVLVFSRRYIRSRVDKLIHDSKQSIESERSNQIAKLEQTLSDKSDTTLQKIEEQLFNYVQITSLRFAKQYDEALLFVNWQGDINPFISYPHPIQRHLITCVANSNKTREMHGHVKAWTWAQKLVDDDPSSNNIQTMLRTGNALRHYDDAVAQYDRVSDRLSIEERFVCEPFLIVTLRKATERPDSAHHYQRRLRDLADKHRDTKDIRVKTTLAAVYRDEGNFEQAEMILRPAIKKTTGFTIREDGWDKLFNTYIANCIDLGHPSDAVQQVKTILAHFHRPDHIFNCARVAWNLPRDSDDRQEIFRLINVRFDDGLIPEKDDGALKTRAILKEVSGESKEAEEILENSIREFSGLDSRWASEQSYFFRCVLAEILISRKEDNATTKAIGTLESVSNNDRIGEAHYQLARAWLQKGNSTVATTHIEAAAKLKRKWIMKAKHDPAFAALTNIDELVSQYV